MFHSTDQTQARRCRRNPLALALALIATFIWSMKRVILDLSGIDAAVFSVRQTHVEVARYTSRLIDTVAPLFLPLGKDGKILLPPSVLNVVFDVGARGSDYLRVMEQIEDNTTALILFDPLPDSIIPLNKRVSDYAMRGGGKWLDPTKQNQVFALRAALGETEGPLDFNVGSGPACGSILQTASKKSFWCFQSSRTLKTIAVRLEDVVDLLPEQIVSVNIKIDAEGADLMVLKGAGRNLQRFDTAIIECRPPDDTRQDHEGECTYEAAKAFMEDQGFNVLSSRDGHGFNMYFIRQNRTELLPPLLRNGQLTFQKFYNNVSSQNA